MEEGDSACYDPKKKERPHAMDLISDLPDTIIHHIMSFLTTLEITTLSILSKRFFNLWGSFPVIEFDHETISGRYQGTPAYETDDFLGHVLNSVLLRRISTDLSEFRVSANLVGISTDLRFDLAILIVLANGVRRMELNLGSAEYLLPTNFASKSINVLKLEGLQLDLCNLIKVCPSLRTLSLTSCAILKDIKFSSKALTEIELYSCSVEYIKINAPNLHLFLLHASEKDPEPCHIDVLQCQNIIYLSLNNVVNGRDWIAEHVSALNKLKTFILKGCQDIEHITVWNDKLERVVICHCSELTSIDVKATSLETFLFERAHQSNIRNITFLTPKYMRDLSIKGATLVTDQWLEAQLAKMPHLKRLSLTDCNSLKKIKVCHEKLQILELNSCHGLVEADIDTPQLVSFMYQGNMIEFAKMVTSSNCMTTLSINSWLTYDNTSFFRWRELLSSFGHCKALKLICSTHKEMMIPELHRERLVSPLYDLQHLEIQIKSLEKIDRDLVDSLLWLSPLLKTLHISSGSCSRLKMIIKFLYSDLIDGEEDTNPFCCVTKPIKCWKHHLKRLEIQSDDVSPRNGSSDLQKYFLSNMTSDILCFSLA